jgi:hypothetical protein
VSGAQPEAWNARRDGLALCCVALAAFLIQLMVYDRWIGLLDEGAILQIATQLNQGAMLYRDATHVAWPGVFYLTAWLFDLFGTQVLVTRWLMVIVFTVMCGIVYVLARGVADRGAALVAASLAVGYRAWALPHWLMISYSSLAFFLLLCAAAVLAWQLRAPGSRRLLAAGVLAGLAIVFKQDSGGLGFVFLLAFVLLDSLRLTSESYFAWLRGALPFVLGAALAPSATLLAMILAGNGPEMLHLTVVVPLVYGKLWAGDSGHFLSFPPLWPPFSRSDVLRQDAFFNYFPSLLLDLHWGQIFRSDLFQKTPLADVLLRVVYLLPYGLIAGLATCEVLRSRRAPLGAPPLRVRRLRLLLFFAAGVLLAFNRPRDWVHLMVLYVPTLILVAPALQSIAGRANGLRRRIAMGAAGAIAAIALIASFTLCWQARSFYDTPIVSDRASVHVQPELATVLNGMIGALATAPGQEPAPLAALPYYPVVNFLTGRPLASRFSVLLPLKKYPDRDQQVLDGIDADPRTEVIYGLQHMTGMPLPQDYAPELFAGLIERYRLGKIFDATQAGPIFGLLERREENATALETVLLDFAEELGGGRFAAPDYDPVAAKGRQIGPSVETWPFERPVVSFPATPAPGTSRLSFRLEDAGAARLRFAVAMNPDEWRHFFPTHLRFRALLDQRVLFDQTLEARLDLSDRRWVFADLPLDDYAGRTLHLEIATNNGYGAGLNLGGFARPRLVRDERVGAITK